MPRQISFVATRGAMNLLKLESKQITRITRNTCILPTGITPNLPDEILIYISTTGYGKGMIPNALHRIGVYATSFLANHGTVRMLSCDSFSTSFGSWIGQARLCPPAGIGIGAYHCLSAKAHKNVISIGIPAHLAAVMSATKTNRIYYSKKIMAFAESLFFFNGGNDSYESIQLNSRNDPESMYKWKSIISDHWNFMETYGFGSGEFARRLARKIEQAPQSLKFIRPWFTLTVKTQEEVCAE